MEQVLPSLCKTLDSIPSTEKKRYITNTVASGEVSDGNVEYTLETLGKIHPFHPIRKSHKRIENWLNYALVFCDRTFQ
jgi:hypothetical protein